MNPSAPSVPQAQPVAPKLPSAFNLFGPSIKALQTNLATFVWLVLTPFLFVIGLVIAITLTTPDPAQSSPDPVAAFITFLVMIAVGVGSVVLSVALLVAVLKGAQGHRVSYTDALRLGLRFSLRYVGLMILFFLALFVGFMLFIVPFFFVMQRFFLAPYYMIDRNLGPIQAMKQSARDAKRFSSGVWGLVGVSLLVEVAAMVPIIGWLVSILYYGAPAVRYEEIKRASGHAPAPAPLPGAPVAASF